MFDTAQKKIRDAILRGELEAGDVVSIKGSSKPTMVIENILESPDGKVARCRWHGDGRTKGLFPLGILKKAE